MAYDQHFAVRIRQVLNGRPIVEKKMFGGVGFMLNGNMICGIHKDDLMLHIATDDTDTLIKRPGAKPFEMRGKAMRGWLLVEPESIKTEAALKKWVAIALTHAESLPPKTPRKPKPKN